MIKHKELDDIFEKFRDIYNKSPNGNVQFDLLMDLYLRTMIIAKNLHDETNPPQIIKLILKNMYKSFLKNEELRKAYYEDFDMEEGE